MSIQKQLAAAKRATALANKLPKGSYAIAHIEKRAYHMHTGAYHWSRFYIVKVLSADKDGRVKAFTDTPLSDAPRDTKHATIYAIPPRALEAAKALFAKQPLDFTGYADKEHLRLALVNNGFAAA